jgi:peptidoglycan/LPS O-acetylase OafA/YrhL
VPALDGLRGIALLGVLLFHANGALPGGYLGVDLFFVLSGFLITALLLAEQRETGRIALSAFWVRRARRLFPALLSLMPAVAVYGRFFARSDELSVLRAQGLATLAYVANWHTIFDHRSYWQLFAAPSPLEHTWSLSIEEQFYLVWPILVVLVLRRGGRRALLGLCLALCAFSVGAMLWLFTPENTTRAYLGTDTRMVGILAGAALATVLPLGRTFQARSVRRLDWLGGVALLGLAVAWARLKGENPFLYRGGFWLTELGVLTLITCAVSGEQSVIARGLSWRPFRLLGTISYGAYLWHWPINVFVTAERAHLHGAPLYALRFALTFAVAVASYRLLEQPIRRHGVPFGRPQYIVPAAVALCAFLVVRATYAREPSGPPPFSSEALASGEASLEAVRYRVVMFGDSTANSLGWGLRGLREKGVAIDLLGKDGCSMLRDSCQASHWAEHVRELKPNAVLVYLGGAFLHGFNGGGFWHTACRADWDSKFERTLTLRLRELEPVGAPVFAVTVPYPLGEWDTPDYRAQVDCINTSLRKSAAAVPGIRVLDLGARLCPDGRCQQELVGNQPVRPDGVHFSLAGAHALSRWVFEQIQP